MTSSARLRILNVGEPALVFGQNQLFEDPKIGLTAFGPYHPPELDKPTPSEIRLGIVGTGNTLDLARNFIGCLKGRLDHRQPGKLHYPPFPGFSTSSPFRCEFLLSRGWEQLVTSKEVAAAMKAPPGARRTIAAARLFLTKIAVILDQEPRPNVVVCATPTEFDADQLESTAIDAQMEARFEDEEARQQAESIEALPELFLELEFAHRPNFHAVLKAGLMKLGIPTQIIRQSTLENAPGTQDPSLVAWNFCIAVYYKAGGTPWRLQILAPDTCYVGLAFYREKGTQSQNMRTAMAHVFTGQAESLVLRGDPVTFDPRKSRSPHLGREGMSKLLQQSLNLYDEHTKHLPRRVVVHKTSIFDENEILGAQDTLGAVNEFDLVAFGTRSLHFFRLGEQSPLRGTMIDLPDRTTLLFTVGYVPLFKLYPGHRIPNPLEIVQHIGDSTSETLCREILALTKMDWNNTDFSQTHPITIGFPRKVGKVLAVTPRDESIQSSYRYYM